MDPRPVLIVKAEEILGSHPGLGRLEVDGSRNRAALVLPKQDESGFDVEVEAHPEGLMLFARGVHVHFDEHYDPELYDTEGLVEAALGLARDLLSSDMRIRELRAGDKPYCWIMESFDGVRWNAEHETGLLFWNYLGRRSELVYQNRALPGRLGKPMTG